VANAHSFSDIKKGLAYDKDNLQTIQMNQISLKLCIYLVDYKTSKK